MWRKYMYSVIPSFQIAGDKGKTFPMFGRIGMGGGSINMYVTSDDNVKLNLCIYPHVLHYLRALFTSKPLIPKTYKGMKAKESLLTRMLNDIERISKEKLNGYRMEVTIIGQLSTGEVCKLAQPIIAKGLPSGFLIRSYGAPLAQKSLPVAHFIFCKRHSGAHVKRDCAMSFIHYQ